MKRIVGLIVVSGIMAACAGTRAGTSTGYGRCALLPPREAERCREAVYLEHRRAAGAARMKLDARP